MTEGRRVVIIRNPRARRAPDERAILEAAAPLEAGGWEFELLNSSAPGHARELAGRALRDGADIVLACGGDGTLNEVANGLAGSDAALGVIPGGTANVWAKEAGVPRDTPTALAWLPAARRARIDLGRARLGDGSERCFLLMCSTGIDAEVVRRVGTGGWRKRKLGPAWYAAVGLTTGLRAQPVPTTFTIDGRSGRRELLMVVAGNTRLYGGVARLTSVALADDGFLDVALFHGPGLWHRARLVTRALRGNLHRHRGDGIDYAKGAVIRIEPDRPLAVQADGEHIGETPLTLDVLPRALTVLLSRAPNPLLGER